MARRAALTAGAFSSWWRIEWPPAAKRFANFLARRLLGDASVSTLRWTSALFVALIGCTSSAPLEIAPSEVNEKADGMANHLKLEDDHRTDIDEPSDLAVRKGKLYAVSDRHSKIYELDNDGDIEDVIEVEGTDLEGLALDEDGHFFIADESKAKVWQLDKNGDREESFDIDTTDGNSGIEGLTFDNDGHMLVAKEKNPATIIILDADDGDEKDRVKLDFADDLSALTWNPDDDHLYALSAVEAKLWRLDGDFDKITSWDLPIEEPEGLAFDGDTLYIASDSEERLYVFELK
jgi:sugar lactone lactonase YvrE